MPDLSFENQYFNQIVAGVDEVGAGPLAGPVVACAVILNLVKLPEGIDDSKKLTPLKRERIAELLKEHCSFAIGIVDSAEIDRINILQARKLAMRKAVEALPVYPDVALVDGNQMPELKCKIVPIIKGDNKSLSIAAASIIAKVFRDKVMTNLAAEFPHYGWEQNAGYGTRQHLEAISKHGITVHHRQSFAPIKQTVFFV